MQIELLSWASQQGRPRLGVRGLCLYLKVWCSSPPRRLGAQVGLILGGSLVLVPKGRAPWRHFQEQPHRRRPQCPCQGLPQLPLERQAGRWPPQRLQWIWAS